MVQRWWKWLLGLALVGIAFLWWLRTPPSPEAVAWRVAHAVHTGDGETLYALACTEERERVSLDQLKRALSVMHQYFPELRRQPEGLTPYRPRVSMKGIEPIDYSYAFFYKVLPNEKILIPCSRQESAALMDKFLQGDLPPDKLVVVIEVSSSAHWRHRCALVVKGMVDYAVRLGLRRGLNDDQIRALLHEIFIKNGITVAQQDSGSGGMRRIENIKFARKSNGQLRYSW